MTDNQNGGGSQQGGSQQGGSQQGGSQNNEKKAPGQGSDKDNKGQNSNSGGNR